MVSSPCSEDAHGPVTDDLLCDPFQANDDELAIVFVSCHEV